MKKILLSFTALSVLMFVDVNAVEKSDVDKVKQERVDAAKKASGGRVPPSFKLKEKYKKSKENKMKGVVKKDLRIAELAKKHHAEMQELRKKQIKEMQELRQKIQSEKGNNNNATMVAKPMPMMNKKPSAAPATKSGAEEGKVAHPEKMVGKVHDNKKPHEAKKHPDTPVSHKAAVVKK